MQFRFFITIFFSLVIYSCLCIMAPEVGWAAEIIVPDQFESISAAIDASSSGDTIRVTAGKYIITTALKLPHPLELIGGGADVTILESDENIAGQSIIIVDSIAGGTKIKGFHLINGGIEARECNTITIERNLIENPLDFGIYLNDKWTGGSSTATILNNTLLNCYRGISSNDWKHLIMYNNIIYGGETGFFEFDISTKDIQYNNIYNCETLWFIRYIGATTPPAGNLSMNPLFTYKAGVNGFLLQNSPCIDAGHPDAIYNDPDGSRNDIGVFAYQEVEYPDADGDGVPDSWDRCPSTPPSTAVYANGCRADDLYEGLDQCNENFNECKIERAAYAEQNQALLTGDFNRDGIVDQNDAAIINDIFETGFYTEGELNQIIENILQWGDIDGDGKIGLQEAIQALKVTGGLKSEE